MPYSRGMAVRHSLICGENLHELETLLRGDYGERAQLVYMDPPFNTGMWQRGAGGEFPDAAKSSPAFADEIAQRAAIAWHLLSAAGSLVVHCDWRSVHYVKVALDSTLGESNFASEIIWRYRRWPAKTANFQRVHDTLLRYVKDQRQRRWNQLYESPADSTIKTFGTSKQSAVVVDGKRVKSKKLEVESPGVPMGDVWDIGIIAPQSRERTGYPTQKPKKLLARLIESTTDEGDLVIDPYCGSGTTCVTAFEMGRDSIGIDRNPQAISITSKRILEVMRHHAT